MAYKKNKKVWLTIDPYTNKCWRVYNSESAALDSVEVCIFGFDIESRDLLWK